MSCLLTYRRLGSAGGSARSSLAGTLLFRLVDALAEVISGACNDAFSVGIKTRFCGLCPSIEELDVVGGGIIGSKEDRMGRRFASMDLKAVEVGAVEVVRDASDVFECCADIHLGMGLGLDLPRTDQNDVNFFDRHHEKIEIGPLTESQVAATHEYLCSTPSPTKSRPLPRG
jgi:hypothetical protein